MDLQKLSLQFYCNLHAPPILTTEGTVEIASGSDMYKTGFWCNDGCKWDSNMHRRIKKAQVVLLRIKSHWESVQFEGSTENLRYGVVNVTPWSAEPQYVLTNWESGNANIDSDKRPNFKSKKDGYGNMLKTWLNLWSIKRTA